VLRVSTAALPLVALALAACDEPTIACDPASNALRSVSAFRGDAADLSQIPPGAVHVTVVDSVTGADLSAGATGTFVTGVVADSLRHFEEGRLTAFGPAGRYSVVVQHPGYATWGADDVRVQAGECAPDAVELTARLRRTSATE
jgi:hypothetical protein